MSKVVSVVFVSLAAWQVHRQRLIVFRVTAERQRWRGWGKVEGRLSGHCGPALTQLTTATDAGAVSPWWRHVFGLVCTRRWINHPLAHAKSFSLNAHMCIWVRQQQQQQQQRPADVWSQAQLDSAAASQNCVIRQMSLWRLTKCLKYPTTSAMSCQIQFQTVSNPFLFPFTSTFAFCVTRSDGVIYFLLSVVWPHSFSFL